MARMVRKQIYIGLHQDQSLKRQARDSGMTEAEVIRRAIDRQMDSIRLSGRDLKAWQREKTFIAKRVAKGRVHGGRRWNREEAYEGRLGRYGG